MNKKYLSVFYSSLLFSPIFCAKESAPTIVNTNNNNIENKPNINIHIDQTTLLEHIANMNLSNITSASANAANNISNAINNATETIINISNDIKNGINNTINQTRELGNQAYNAARHPFILMSEAYDWGTNNKFTVGLYITAMTYIYINYLLIKTKYLLTHGTHWSLWDPTATLEELFTIPQQQLGQALARAAQERYTTAENPHDFVGPLAQFMLDIESELTLLKSYMRLCHWIKHFCLRKVMWFNENFLHECAKRKTRLTYLKAAFTHWIADYKLTQNMVQSAT
jgi:hypothetical protein